MKVYLECFGCLKHGGDVNASDNMEQTALHWAAVRGSIAAADVLLQNGAQVEASDINGYRVTVYIFIPKNILLLKFSFTRYSHFI